MKNKFLIVQLIKMSYQCKECEPYLPGIFHRTTTKSTHYSQWGRLTVQKRARLEKKKQNKNKNAEKKPWLPIEC